MTSDVTSVADRLAQAVADLADPGILSVYLFGSHARGRAHRESDVDVGVLLRHAAYPTARDRFEARLRLILHLTRSLSQRDIDVVILNGAPPHLGRAIVTQGRRVHCTDEAADHAFVRDVQLRAGDVEPWLRRVRALKLDAIGR